MELADSNQVPFNLLKESQNVSSLTSLLSSLNFQCNVKIVVLLM